MSKKAYIERMVNRFLAWKLPNDFNPDGGISFKAEYNEGTAHPGKHEPTGTNLLTATQAKAMVEHMVNGETALQRFEELWHYTAGLISYHHADDSGKEWGRASALKPLLLELERQVLNYGGNRPTGEYLLGSDFRIQWPSSGEGRS